jgi:hypothetical protein
MGKPSPVGEPPSQAAASAARLAAALARCLDVSIGTVWRIREDAWRDYLAHYDGEKRDWHPGLSVRAEPVSSLYEMIPLLFGSSSWTGPVPVRGLTRERGPRSLTWFGRRVQPAYFPVPEFADPRPSPRSRAHPGELVGRDLDRYRVAVNHDKPRLDPDELEDLKRWARSRRLLP